MIRKPPPHAVAVALSCYAVWVLLTWTLTLEFLTVGAAIALAVTAACLPIFRDTGRIRITVRGVGHALVLAARIPPMVIRANVGLARRIWSPSLPLNTGMVTVPTRVHSDAGLATVGIVTSLIVDNQIVDVDRRRHRLLYHAIDVPEGGPSVRYDDISGAVDRLVAAIEGSAAE